MAQEQDPKLLSDLILELSLLRNSHGDRIVEAYDSIDTYSVPYVFYSEDSDQYYLDFAEERLPE
jgi:hypothetical protein